MQKLALSVGMEEVWIHRGADVENKGHGRMTNYPSLSWAKRRTRDFQLEKSQADWDKLVTQGRGRGKAVYSWQLELWTEKNFFSFTEYMREYLFPAKWQEEDITS